MIALPRCRSLKISRSMAKRKTATITTQKRKAQSATSARKVQALEREEQILQLRIGGARYQQIADRLGIVPSTVGRALQRGMARWQAQADDLASEAYMVAVRTLRSAPVGHLAGGGEGQGGGN